MIVGDLREIARVVLGSGLNDSLYKEDSPVYDKIQFVGSILDITPRQVVMLSVAINIGTRSVNTKNIAHFCKCAEDYIETYKWDLLVLCLKGYLHISNVYPGHKVYCIPFGLLECWKKGKVFHTGICPSSDVKYNRLLFADQVYNNILKLYWIGKAPKLCYKARKNLDSIIYEFGNFTLCRHLNMACQELFCPSSSLGKHVLLLVIANTLHPVQGKRLGKDEIRTILFGDKPTETEDAELYCTFDFLIKTNRLQWDGQSLKLDGIFMDWVAGDLDLDLVIPYESIQESMAE